MKTYTHQEQQNIRTAAKHTQETPDLMAQVNDQRPQAGVQRKLDVLADNSPKVQQQKGYQNLADQAIQRMGGLEEEELLQGKFEAAQRMGGLEEEELLQGKFETAQRMDGLEEEELLQGKFDPVQRKENNTGLPDSLKAGVESLSGMSIDDVQVHYNSDRPAPLQAHAFTQGTDIHVAAGQEKHLAHEAWHVVQQKQGRVQPTMSLNGQNVNDSPSLEKEADVMGAKAQSQQFKR
jgi:hypothetical protein